MNLQAETLTYVEGYKQIFLRKENHVGLKVNYSHIYYNKVLVAYSQIYNADARKL